MVFLELKEWKGKTMKAYLCRLVFASTIYNIWRNRNALKHNNNPCIKEKLIQRIRWEVRTGLLRKVDLKRLEEMIFFVMLGV